MRYYPATPEELNRAYEDHQAAQVPSPELDLPPTSMGQVLAWCSDLGLHLNHEQVDQARALSPTTTLAEVLQHLGGDLTAYGR